MNVIYEMTTEEVNPVILENIKALFEGKRIRITVEAEEDETEYLLKNPANREKLLKAVEDVRNNKNLITVDIGEFK